MNYFFPILFVSLQVMSYAQESLPEPDLIDAKDVIGEYYYTAFQPNATKLELNADLTYEMIDYSRAINPLSPSGYKREKTKGTWVCRDDTVILSQLGFQQRKYIAFKGRLFFVSRNPETGKDIPVPADRVEQDSCWIRKKK